MRNRLLVLPAVASGLLIVATAAAAARPARNTAGPGVLTAVAPDGNYVTLRVTAADAAGGRISETITRAYKIASWSP